MRKAVVLNDTTLDNHHGCTLVMRVMAENLRKVGLEIIDRGFVGQDWQKNERLKKSISNADIVIVNGEGTIHHNRLAGLSLLKVAKFCKESRVSCVLINSTYQDNDISYKKYLEHFSLITVRESYSKNELDKIGIESSVVADLSFYTEVEGKSRTSQIGVTDSVIRGTTEALYLMANTNSRYVYCPIIFEDPTLAKTFACLKGMKNLISKKLLLDPALLLKLITSYLQQRRYFEQDDYQYIENISRFRMLVSARYHALCFATICLTPFVALASNSHKIEGMLHDIGVDNKRILSVESLTPESVEENSIFTSQELSNIKTYCFQAKKNIEEMFEKIAILSEV